MLCILQIDSLMTHPAVCKVFARKVHLVKSVRKYEGINVSIVVQTFRLLPWGAVGHCSPFGSTPFMTFT